MTSQPSNYPGATKGAARPLTSQTHISARGGVMPLRGSSLAGPDASPGPPPPPSAGGSHEGDPQLPGNPAVGLSLPQLHGGKATPMPPRAGTSGPSGKVPNAPPPDLYPVTRYSFSRWPSSPRFYLPWNSLWPQPMNIWSRGSES